MKMREQLTFFTTSIGAKFAGTHVSGHLRGVCQLMQPGGRQFQPVGPTQGTGIHKAAAEVSWLAQCFQQGALSGGEVGRAVENALRVVAETQLQHMGLRGGDVQQLDHGWLLVCLNSPAINPQRVANRCCWFLSV